jgi:hypothetical protein
MLVLLIVIFMFFFLLEKKKLYYGKTNQGGLPLINMNFPLYISGFKSHKKNFFMNFPLYISGIKNED